MNKLELETPVSDISRIGKSAASRLKRLGIETVNDLIFYYPFRWEDLSKISEISDIKPDETFTIRGKLQLIKSRRSPVKKRLLTEGLVKDNSGSIKVIWFNQPYLTKVLNPGDEIYLSGKVSFDRYTLQLINPVYEKVKKESATHTARLVPIYSVTENLTQKQIRYLIKESLPAIRFLEDYLPEEVIKENNLVDWQTALAQIHFPKDQKSLDLSIKRLKFNELLLFQLQVLMSKLEHESSSAEPIGFYEDATKKFVNLLPFTLTNDQRKAAWKILSDLQRTKPMNRLLEGEVGSGKTVVAAIAMLNVFLNDKQVVLMAPTEILAAQHYKNILGLFEKLKIKIALLSRTQFLVDGKESSKKKVLDQINSGEIQVIIGTHALIQEKIEFKNLALAVIDEQHRFGVSQRKLLKEKSGDLRTVPHLLSMTATPIPRSLALTLYGDLDLTLIKELPVDRKKIITKIVNPGDRAKTYDFIRSEIKAGRQAFVICPLIDPSDKLGVKAVTEEYKIIKKEVFPDLEISMLHGKLKSAQKESIMKEFLAKLSDVLVATAVVEVGVDVPNATVMLIEGAERFGLAQLHQFRGRVGRSKHQSYCFLFTENSSQKSRSRLEALISAKDGFELAEFDLEFRGPGEIYGVKQSGWLDFKIAKLSDHEIIAQAKEAAEKIISQSPDLKKYPLLYEQMRRFMETVHFE
ncbi:ATP-dependent DNA helicase RecG [Candidatus Falkowbacteria bacterium]|nr:ATP-dependent DNA helicase RecG [Candidatus Falkowbacteria bacterium]